MMKQDGIDVELRSHVTMIGVLLLSLSVGAIMTYAVLQVPTLRSIYGDYQLGDAYLNHLVYTLALTILIIIYVYIFLS